MPSELFDTHAVNGEGAWVSSPGLELCEGYPMAQSSSGVVPAPSLADGRHL